MCVAVADRAVEYEDGKELSGGRTCVGAGQELSGADCIVRLFASANWMEAARQPAPDLSACEDGASRKLPWKHEIA